MDLKKVRYDLQPWNPILFNYFDEQKRLLRKYPKYLVVTFLPFLNHSFPINNICSQKNQILDFTVRSSSKMDISPIHS